MTATPSPWVIDADPVETAAAIAKTMHRLASETSTLTTLNQAPQITDELLSALREMATITTHLARLSFDHPTPAAPDGDLGAFTRRSPAVRAADGFNDATNLIYLACQPLSGAKNATTRLVGTAPPLSKQMSPASDAATRPSGRSERSGQAESSSLPEL